MRYLCLVHFEARDFEGQTPAERKQCDEDALAYDRKLMEDGHFIAAAALQSPETATIVRNRRGKLSIIDGPFAETKEQLGGFILIEAVDLNEAIRIAAGIPMAKLGSIEVRPVYEFS